MVLLCKGDVYDSSNQEHCHLNAQSSSRLGHVRQEKKPARDNHDKLWSFRRCGRGVLQRVHMAR
jgi:hypothetical protein